MKIAMGCDPNAESFKQEMIACVESLGHEVRDFGSEDVIYAYTACRVAEAVAAKEYDRGIFFCGAMSFTRMTWRKTGRCFVPLTMVLRRFFVSGRRTSRRNTASAMKCYGHS